VTLEDQRSDFAMRVALAKQADRRAAARRADLVLRVTALTLLWLVSVSLLVGLGVANGARAGESSAPFVLAAAVAVLLPFVVAVIATRLGEVWIGGAYVVLTLVMVIPALGILGLP
jgi:hypothetical protein